MGFAAERTGGAESVHRFFTKGYRGIARFSLGSVALYRAI